MGLFDSFLSDTMLECPVCGTELGKDLQTKALGQGMSSWRVGDRVDIFDVHIAGIVCPKRKTGLSLRRG